MDINSYDKIIVAFSGGKDSTACFLHLIDLGVPMDKIELWHHDVDGFSTNFIDWGITQPYCYSFAEAFGVILHFSGKSGGFLREMNRKDQPTAPTIFTIPKEEYKEEKEGDWFDSIEPVHKWWRAVGGKGPKGTRGQFPQVSADLKVRWCSAYLKIDVCAAAIRNQERFNNSKTLVVSGERGEESSARAKYLEFEVDRADGRKGKSKRHVDRWRPIKNWTETQVWDIIKRHGVNVHPAYYAGFGRVSCAFCIFANADQIASAEAVQPMGFKMISEAEVASGKTIKRNESVEQLLERGTTYPALTQKAIRNMRSYDPYKFDSYPIIETRYPWFLPAGAFGDKTGPI